MEPPSPIASPWLAATARGVALFLGGFSLLNVLGEWRRAGFDANEWWIDLRALPPPLGTAFLILAATMLIVLALRPFRAAGGRWICRILNGGLALAALANTAVFYRLAAQGVIHPGCWFPFSLLILAALSVILLAPPAPLDRRHRAWAALVFAAALFTFPIGQMICFGKTDYRRPADAIVVFGARAYADGRPSQALADRVRTACRLYQPGQYLIFSGGPGDGRFHETDAMRNLAIALGIPPQAILVDLDGLNTDLTVQNTVPLFAQRQIHTVLAVSHFYHLPRVKMTYRRAGWEVYTVPAYEPYPLRRLPVLMLREIAALWSYYLRPLLP